MYQIQTIKMRRLIKTYGIVIRINLTTTNHSQITMDSKKITAYENIFELV